jgi:hypothetical protein
VGLGAREDEPSLREVVARFPDIRFVRLRPCRAARSSPATSRTRRDRSLDAGRLDEKMRARLTGWRNAGRPFVLQQAPAWSRVDDDSVMQWPVVELAEWEELRQCPSAAATGWPPGPTSSRAG